MPPLTRSEHHRQEAAAVPPPPSQHQRPGSHNQSSANQSTAQDVSARNNRSTTERIFASFASKTAAPAMAVPRSPSSSSSTSSFVSARDDKVDDTPPPDEEEADDSISRGPARHDSPNRTSTLEQDEDEDEDEDSESDDDVPPDHERAELLAESKRSKKKSSFPHRARVFWTQAATVALIDTVFEHGPSWSTINSFDELDSDVFAGRTAEDLRYRARVIKRNWVENDVPVRGKWRQVSIR